MSDTQQTQARPWHGAESPFEALYQWAQAEFRKLRGEPEESLEPAKAVEDQVDAPSSQPAASLDPEQPESQT